MSLRTIFIVIIYLVSVPLTSQVDKIASCHIDTIEMTLAYEFSGQFSLDDMFFKQPEFVAYHNNLITLADYESGIYHYNSFLPNKLILDELQRCGCKFEYNLDSHSINFKNIESKRILQRNYAFSGKGTSFSGDSLFWQYHDFEYTIFKLKFVGVYIGNGTRRIVNIDKKHQDEEDVVSIDCPVFAILKIIELETLD